MQPPAAPWSYQRGGPLSPNYGAFGGGPVATSGRSMNDPGRMMERVGRMTRRDPRMQMAVAGAMTQPEFQTGRNAQQPTPNNANVSGLDWLYANGPGRGYMGGNVPPAGGSQPKLTPETFGAGIDSNPILPQVPALPDLTPPGGLKMPQMSNHSDAYTGQDFSLGIIPTKKQKKAYDWMNPLGPNSPFNF